MEKPFSVSCHKGILNNYWAKRLKSVIIEKFFARIFSYVVRKLYLCTRLEKLRALSSAGLEHLPYKQRVGGSNPSAPTTIRM